ncbi:MAG TPA: hypothetical protein PKK40_03925, partial [Marmoricola sp.]|nr:hypothetical protein [Marmoricola sp.]
MSDVRVDFAPSTGPVLGWVSVAGLALVIGISLNADRSRGTLLMVAGMAVLAVLLYAYLIRPRVRVRGD